MPDKKTKKKPLNTKKPIKVAEKAQKRQELSIKDLYFCKLYIEHDVWRGNATMCYSEAFNYNLEELSKVRPKNGESEYEKKHRVCRVMGARLLAKTSIQKHCNKLLKKLFTAKAVDRELTRVMTQDEDRASKMAAIREFNKLKKRITDKLDLTSKGQPIKMVSYEEVKPKNGK